MKESIKISLETEDISRLNEAEMDSALGGSSWWCATIPLTADVAMWVIDKLDKDKRSDGTSEIIVEGCCELNPAYCYSYSA